jgi:hypothetical protein
MQDLIDSRSERIQIYRQETDQQHRQLVIEETVSMQSDRAQKPPDKRRKTKEQFYTLVRMSLFAHTVRCARTP